MNCIAIFDIGKTNKKLFLIDEHYQIVWEKSACLQQTTDEEGDPCEDVALLTSWVQEGIFEVLHMHGFTIKAFNFSAYGASLVYLDEWGETILPLYNYLKPYPAKLQMQFNRDCDPEGLLNSETASPALGSLNAGLQLYRLKHLQTELYDQVRHVLHLPQFLSYTLTRRILSDITSIGCHTLLWDFTNNCYHRWVQQEGLAEKLPPLFPGDGVLEVGPYVSGVGLHDSSSALIPYLTTMTEPFVLISTGTWCITLNPFNEQPLTPEELEQDCLCYFSYKGKPVKASRLFAGNEHEQQLQRLAEYYQTPVNYYQQVVFDPVIFAHLLEVEDAPASMAGLLQVSRFRQRDLSGYATYETAYHRLLMDIMQQQQQSANLVIAGTPVKRIFVDGGFGRNQVYMQLLADAFPEMEVYAASVAQSTAIGAALAIHAYWNVLPVPNGLVQLNRVTALANGSLTH